MLRDSDGGDSGQEATPLGIPANNKILAWFKNQQISPLTQRGGNNISQDGN